MAYQIDLLENLVYKIFGNPIFFGLVMICMFAYFATKYDIGKWGLLMFFGGFVTWVSIFYIGEWMLILVLIAASFGLSVAIFRRIRA